MKEVFCSFLSNSLIPPPPLFFGSASTDFFFFSQYRELWENNIFNPIDRVRVDHDGDVGWCR